MGEPACVGQACKKKSNGHSQTAGDVRAIIIKDSQSKVLKTEFTPATIVCVCRSSDLGEGTEF